MAYRPDTRQERRTGRRRERRARAERHGMDGDGTHCYGGDRLRRAGTGVERGSWVGWPGRSPSPASPAGTGIDLDRVDMSGGGDGGGRRRRRPSHVCLPPPSSCSNDWSPSVRRRWSSGRAPPPPLPHLCRSQSQAAASRPRLRRSPPSPPAAPALAVRRRR
uniref:Uncharacterized protein n=1 Tax=Oryza rufipogon TaxID=4529 RepID=A0A0E0PGN5_ORYRU